MKQEKKDWIVKMECVVRKTVVVENCTEEQARTNPWDYAEDEYESETVDWQVISIEENK